MRRCMPLCFALLVLSACRGQDATTPVLNAPQAPVTMKFDGNNGGGNPDFFFLPPLAPDPATSPNYDPGASNVSLTPSVDVCVLDVSGATQAAMQASITASTPCKGNPVFTATLGPGNVSRGILDDLDIDLLRFIATHYPSLTEPYYHIGWKVPVTARPGSPALPTFYRISVRVGKKALGFVDVESINNLIQLLNVDLKGYVPIVGGALLPINFRVEKFALCDNPADKTAPCTTVAVDLTAGGTVQTVLKGTTQPSGITIPPGAGTSTVNITVQSCEDFNPRVTDLPTFGRCVRVTSEPALPPGGFAVPATVFNCNVSDVAPDVTSRVRSHAQADRITMHQLDFVSNGDGGMVPVLQALPHAAACSTPIGAAPATLQGMLAALRRGEVRAAAREAMAMLSPKPLYASMFIDLGGGGLLDHLSDFQFALPAAFRVDPTTDNLTADGGSVISPKITVVDLGNEPVRGARVTFQALTGAANPTVIEATGSDGIASTAWTLSTTVAANTLKARGRGIAGTDYHGPRAGVIDPFQPIQPAFDPGVTPAVPSAVRVLTGSVEVHATALLAPIDAFPYQSDGYRYLLIGSGNPPAGWEQPGFAMAGWYAGSAPFASVEYCAGTPRPSTTTTWPIGSTTVPSDILVRKTFSTRTAGPVDLPILIDNDIQIFVDGTEITNGFFVHEGCAHQAPPTFTIPNLPAGNHVLAIRARDRGYASYLDVSLARR